VDPAIAANIEHTKDWRSGYIGPLRDIVLAAASSPEAAITISDDGIGLPDGETWPRRGKLGALIAQSLRENARADLKVTSSPDMGTTVTIEFDGPGVMAAAD
jgi:two-component sensor histidine kinase